MAGKRPGKRRGAAPRSDEDRETVPVLPDLPGSPAGNKTCSQGGSVLLCALAEVALAAAAAPPGLMRWTAGERGAAGVAASEGTSIPLVMLAAAAAAAASAEVAAPAVAPAAATALPRWHSLDRPALPAHHSRHPLPAGRCPASQPGLGPGGRSAPSRGPGLAARSAPCRGSMSAAWMGGVRGVAFLKGTKAGASIAKRRFKALHGQGREEASHHCLEPVQRLGSTRCPLSAGSSRPGQRGRTPAGSSQAHLTISPLSLCAQLAPAGSVASRKVSWGSKLPVLALE